MTSEVQERRSNLRAGTLPTLAEFIAQSRLLIDGIIGGTPGTVVHFEPFPKIKALKASSSREWENPSD